MGIMYKLMKHRNLTVDLNAKPLKRNKSDKCRLLAMDAGRSINNDDFDVTGRDNDDGVSSSSSGGGDYSPTLRKLEGEIEKRFTAEHILQLCKFLAEKSKRNKNLHKQQQSPKKITKAQKTFQFQPMDYTDDDINDNEEDCRGNDSDNLDNDDMVYDNEDAIRRRMYQQQGLPLLSHSRTTQDQQQMSVTTSSNISVLSSRLSPDINALNISSSNGNHQILRLQQQQQHPGLEQDFHHQPHLLQHQQQQHQNQATSQYHQQGKRDILLKIRHQIFERKRLREKGYEPQALNATTTQVWRPW